METYEEHFKKIVTFIQHHNSLMNCHLVDFITDDLWNNCLASNLSLELQNLEKHHVDVFKGVNRDECPTLSNFLYQTNFLSLKNCSGVLNVDEISSLSTPHCRKWQEFDNDNVHELMKDKKKYEIDIFAKVVGYLSKLNSSLVIDAGAGKGYLATSLYQNYKIPVLAIDSCESKHKSALKRQKLLKKKNNQVFPLVQHSVNFIDDTINFSEIVQRRFDNNTDFNQPDNYLLAGLHTCGSLALALIRSFLNSDCLKSLCVVSCCYHLTNECLTGALKLSKNSRMLAQQSVDRTYIKEQPCSLFFRVILQVFLKSIGITDVKVGKGGPTIDFPTYATWALKKIGLPEHQIPPSSDLETLYSIHAGMKWKFNTFHFLRIHLGSVIEAALILDRVLYLKQSNKCSKLSIIRLFDPILSPRCYAIVAMK